VAGVRGRRSGVLKHGSGVKPFILWTGRGFMMGMDMGEEAHEAAGVGSSIFFGELTAGLGGWSNGDMSKSRESVVGGRDWGGEKGCKGSLFMDRNMGMGAVQAMLAF